MIEINRCFQLKMRGIYFMGISVGKSNKLTQVYLDPLITYMELFQGKSITLIILVAVLEFTKV